MNLVSKEIELTETIGRRLSGQFAQANLTPNDTEDSRAPTYSPIIVSVIGSTDDSSYVGGEVNSVGIVATTPTIRSQKKRRAKKSVHDVNPSPKRAGTRHKAVCVAGDGGGGEGGKW